MKKIAVLSPHLDDGVLSCGEYIAKEVNAGNEVTIITFFTGYPLSNELSLAAKIYHSNCFLSDNSMEYRKQEDKCACALLGCKYVHLDYYECLYRKNDQNMNIYPKLSDIYHSDRDDEQYIGLVAEKIKSLFYKYDVILAPLGLGKHADHQLLYIATCRVADSYKSKIIFYEEIPYICYMNESNIPININGMTSELIYVTKEEWSKKVSAVLCYRSQLHIMWKNEMERINQLNKAVRMYKKNKLSMRVWRLID